MDHFLCNLQQHPPALTEAVESFEQLYGEELPSDYRAFLFITNGGQGFVGDNGFVNLWRVEELSSLNDAYEVRQRLPGLLVFGSNGGGEAFGFDIRRIPWSVVQVPFLDMSWETAWQKGSSFREFLARLYEGTD